jgi:DNA-binding XRE family transcriptional regulator
VFRVTIQDRLVVIRGKMSQEKFGERIGVKRFTISNYESGRRSLTDRVKTDICREFSVNRQWLETGEGEMLAQDGSLLTQLEREYDLDGTSRRIVEMFVTLPGWQRSLILAKATELAVLLQGKLVP